jgi:hypothetical protein
MTETNKLSDGFLATWRICPYCGSGNTRAIFGLVNAGYLFQEVIVSLAVLALAVFTGYTPHEGESRPFTLKRVCRQCRGRFWPKREQKTPINFCGQCGYNLTGNVSGVCPECGWELPEEVKQQVRGSRPGGSEEYSCEHRSDNIRPGR